jgi:murein DD-endopeptidase MepM/ murein hydrolase activator NlpD
MSCVLELLRSRFWPRAAVLTLMSIGVAACSGEASRFGDNAYGPKGNPDATGSIPQQQAAPVNRVESRPLPPTAQLPPPQSGASAPYTVATGSGVAGGGRGLASYSPPSPSPPTPIHTGPSPSSYTPASYSPASAHSTPVGAPDVTGSVVAPKPGPSTNWSWDGGTAVTVGPGETIETIARRYGVPSSVIMQANNIAAPATIHPGQQLVIPRYKNAPGTAAATAPAAALALRPSIAAPKPASVPAGNPSVGHQGVHVVAAGETLTKISRLYGKPIHEIAKANNILAGAKLNVGDRLVIPGVRTSALKPNAIPIKPVPAVAQAKPAPAAAPNEPEPAVSASVFAPVAEAPGSKDSVKLADAAGSLPKFRWPANGRVIAGYGPTTNGQQNDGINIAVPENTPVKAAEDGVVAYAGNELKGYGNLILVRHPNGYVTAYAHAKELVVKRGDQVKRGQLIARSGQTGNVNAPQLHFEIRKGASPLDPMRFLNGA